MYDGRLAIRCLKANIAAMHKAIPAHQWAASQDWINRDEVVSTLKANVGASDVDGGYATHADRVDFAAAVRQVSVLDRLGARRLPPYTRLLGLNGITISAFVPEGRAIPVSRSDMVGFVLEPAKVGGIVVVANDAIESSDIDAEKALADALAQGLASMTDYALLNPDGDGSDGNPISITYEADAFPSAGSAIANIDADVQRAVDRMVSHGSNLLNVRWVMRPETATYLATLRGSGGSAAYPGIGAKGGQLAGLDVITSAGVPASGSPLTSMIALIDGDAIAYADGDAEMRQSTSAMLEMADDATGDTLTPTAVSKAPVSMFQDNCTAIKVLRRVNWKRRNERVVVITGVSF